ncbi:hypothetical protein ABZW03_39420, partial [Kitasatospora sp. NPDC004799]
MPEQRPAAADGVPVLTRPAERGAAAATPTGGPAGGLDNAAGRHRTTPPDPPPDDDASRPGLDDEGNGQESWVLQGMEWAAARAPIVNLSLT